jgi:hypothetical protein
VSGPTVHIHYRRPPDRLDVFEQELLFDAPGAKVTLQRSIPVEEQLSEARRHGWVDDALAGRALARALWFSS